MRLFFALNLPLTVRKTLSNAQQEAERHGIEGPYTSFENLHATLLFLGERSESQYRELLGKMANFSFPKFTVTAGGSGFFPDSSAPRIWWAGLQGVSRDPFDLHRHLSQQVGMNVDEDYTPHITLARFKKPPATEALTFLKKFEDAPFGEFSVEQVTLKKSTTDRTGAVYEDLNTFPLK